MNLIYIQRDRKVHRQVSRSKGLRHCCYHLLTVMMGNSSSLKLNFPGGRWRQFLGAIKPNIVAVKGCPLSGGVKIEVCRQNGRGRNSPKNFMSHKQLAIFADRAFSKGM